jgi:hypothetical protein
VFVEIRFYIEAALKSSSLPDPLELPIQEKGSVIHHLKD